MFKKLKLNNKLQHRLLQLKIGIGKELLYDRI